MPKQPAAPPDFRKEPVRLPDGRSLTYYWFDDREPPAAGNALAPEEAAASPGRPRPGSRPGADG